MSILRKYNGDYITGSSLLPAVWVHQGHGETLDEVYQNEDQKQTA